MRVEVIAAWPHRVWRRSLTLPEGATVAQAVELCGCPERASISGTAIFGQRCKPEDVLRDGDRLELLRGLEVDPKTARHLRAQAQRDRKRVR